ncbi:hypothetical protein BN1097_160064 [Clostridioides difficile]|uniref:Uncharacterized protein n=1 Tax=Clostridioides difficile TaxID=1496 RepID=A0A069A2M5_CLODI|nr:hypothetical protein BN1097_160064 [Clostridioides difficile]
MQSNQLFTYFFRTIISIYSQNFVLIFLICDIIKARKHILLNFE